MPYIKQEDRPKIDEFVKPLAYQISNPGEFNYAVTCLTHMILDKKLNYEAINAMIGALECCKLEIYRRVAAPYEDNKVNLNGDVLIVNPTPANS